MSVAIPSKKTNPINHLHVDVRTTQPPPRIESISDCEFLSASSTRVRRVIEAIKLKHQHAQCFESTFMLGIAALNPAYLSDRGSDHNKQNMGLNSWEAAPKGKIQRYDVAIAKNYHRAKSSV